MTKAKRSEPVRRGDPPGKREYRSRDLPNRLRHARLVLSVKRGSQVSAADVADVIGIAANTISRYEGGKLSEPSLRMIEALAEVLEVTPEWLAFGVGDAEKAKEPLQRAKPTPLVKARSREELEAAHKTQQRKNG